MNTVRIIIPLFLILNFCMGVFAQTNFLPAKIINNSGHTLMGEIDYRNWDKNPNKITFRKLESQETLEFTPKEIQSFTVSDEVYVSAIVETEALNNNQFNQTPNIETIVETVYLQTVIEGKKSLFLFKNEASRDNFYIKENGKYILLKYKKYFKEQKVNGSNKNFVAENKYFLGQLAAYLIDCPEIQKSINNTEYKKESLTRLFLSYFECIGGEIKFEKKKEKTLTKFGVIGGVSMTSLSFSGQNHPNLTNVDYGISTDPAFGLSVDFIFPRNLRKWALTSELMFAGYKFNGENFNEITPNHIENSKTNFEYSQIKSNNMLKYSMIFNRTEWFFNGGFSFGFAINETNHEFLQTTFFNTVSTKNRNAIETDRVAEVGIVLGTGLRMGKFSGEIRYENGNGMSNFPSLLSTTQKLFFLVGYRF